MDRNVVTRDLRAVLAKLDALHDRVEEQRAVIRQALEIIDKGFDDIVAEVTDFYSLPPTSDSQAGHIRGGINAILIEERPLHRKEILFRLERQGYHVGGKKPLDLLSAHLSNDKRFKSLSQGIWTLVTEPDNQIEQVGLGHISTLDGDVLKAS